jgi:hypothetical protein
MAARTLEGMTSWTPDQTTTEMPAGTPSGMPAKTFTGKSAAQVIKRNSFPL